MIKSYFFLLLCIVQLIFGTTVNAQKTNISGIVLDAETKEALPFVNIAFNNSKIGTTTNIDGKYSIETYYATDSLVASFVGYSKLKKKVKLD